MRHSIAALLLVLSLILTACGGKEPAPEAQSVEAEPVSQESTQPAEVATRDSSAVLKDGLLATLKLAADRTVEELGKPGGFADNEALQLQLPSSLDGVASALKKMGQEQLLEDFKDSMNEAARTSIAASPEILGKAISGMQVNDALAIWKGGETAATDYLEEHTRALISDKMLPIISQKTSESGATRYFKQIVDMLPKQKTGLMGSITSMTGVEIPEDFDLDNYVSEKALDGLYAKLAEEEKKIRENPAARTGELVKSAFEFLKR